MPQAALSDLRVLEISQTVAAPFCGKLLAGFGAEVIKLEPLGGEPGRSRGPFKDDEPHPETGASFLFLDTGKKSITLDSSSRTGRDVLLRLLRESDVLITDLEPAGLEEAHLGYEELRKENPRLVHAAITFFGLTGPYRDYRADELTGFAMGGYLYITGPPDREPVKAAGCIGQYQGGLQAATAVMAALMQRALTGSGQLVDISIAEALCYETGALAPWANLGQLYTRVGNRLPSGSGNPTAPYPSTFLPCKDGWVHAHHAPAGFELLAVLMEEPRLASPEVVAAPTGHADLIDELCLPWLSRYDKFEAVRRAQELRHPFTEVLDIPEVLADPQHEARGYFTEVDHPAAGRVKQPGAPFSASGTPWETRRPPLLGEHNVEIYGRLGYGPGDLVLLSERGVI